MSNMSSMPGNLISLRTFAFTASFILNWNLTLNQIASISNSIVKIRYLRIYYRKTSWHYYNKLFTLLRRSVPCSLIYSSCPSVNPACHFGLVFSQKITGHPNLCTYLVFRLQQISSLADLLALPSPPPRLLQIELSWYFY